jgi:nitronate monooxygenase
VSLESLKIKDKEIRLPIIQGGMGVGVSMHPLAAAVAHEGGVGIVSSACIDRIVSKRRGKKVNTYDAVYEEISLSKEKGGIAGINVMVALFNSYETSVKAAIDAGADIIISGAGLPMNLPTIQKPKDTALIPIVSSARALRLICKKWERVGYRPDAVVLEGPLAGGHLGFSYSEIDSDSNRLENLLPQVKDMAREHGDFPVIVAGGIYDHEDIRRFIALGADGVQMGTRFLATDESSASGKYKKAVVQSTEKDIIIAEKPASPCGLPFRIIRQSPMYEATKGYLLLRDRKTGDLTCQAKESNIDSFCICNGLLSSADYNPNEEPPLYTVGTNASRVNRIMSVRELMEELSKPGVTAVAV